MRARNLAGLIAGAFIILSSAAHSLLGWKVLSGRLESAQAPDDLILGLKLGWHFGGAAMLAMGLIVVIVFSKRLRDVRTSTVPAQVIALVYLAYGAWAWMTSHDPFFLIFVLPGLLLAVASYRNSRIQY